MTKNQTVELLKQQLPGFYSVEQVIDIINAIEEEGQVQTYSPEQIEKLLETIDDKVERAINNLYSDDLVDTSTAEFSLSGNEIILDSVEANTSEITEAVMEKVKQAILDFFPAPKETA